MSKLKVLEHPYVFIVLEFAEGSAQIHGVYANKDEAQGKKIALELKYAVSNFGAVRPGYIAILKKPLLGKTLENHDDVVLCDFRRD